MAANEKNNWLHACGRTDGANPALILVAGTGNWSIARAGAGLFDVTLQDPIDALERIVIVCPKVTSLNVAVPTAADTDTVFRVSQEDDASTLTDGAFDFMVIRAAS